MQQEEGRGHWVGSPPLLFAITQAGDRDTPGPLASVCHRKSLSFIQAVALLAPAAPAAAAAAAAAGPARRPAGSVRLGGASAVGAEAVQDSRLFGRNGALT